MTSCEPNPDSLAEIAALRERVKFLTHENAALQEGLTQARAQMAGALEQRTATSEILRVISSTHADVQPVFETILTGAVRLLRGHSGALTRLAGAQIELAAHTSVDHGGDVPLRFSPNR